MKSEPTRVLIIDDDPVTRTLLVSALRKDCLVAVATEGAEGFQKALELVPNVAIVDINMPGWDGLKTLAAFRAHPALKNVKVIILTADGSQQTVVTAVRGGAHDYLLKTAFSRAEFYRKLNRLVPGTIPEETPFGATAEANPAHAAVAPPADSTPADGPLHDAENANRHASSQSHLVAASPTSDSRLQELIDGWE